jgi:catechol 2,3-dioxygenase-like lactoylglutathione lyase family enzyme
VIDHVSIAVADLERSAAFYAAVLAPLELTRLFARDAAAAATPARPARAKPRSPRISGLSSWIPTATRSKR